MGIASIWDKNGNWLRMNSKGFSCRSTGCSCCSVELETEAEVKREAIDSLRWVWLASRYFKWDFEDLLKQAEKLHKEESK